MPQSTEADVAVRELNSRFRGEVIPPGDKAYDEARRVWNAMIDKRPGLIARPRDAADVVAAVDFARERGIPVAVRCGGHSVAGKSVSDGGLLIDLSLMKGVHVDPERRIARANAGALWGEFDSNWKTNCSMAGMGRRVLTPLVSQAIAGRFQPSPVERLRLGQGFVDLAPPGSRADDRHSATPARAEPWHNAAVERLAVAAAELGWKFAPGSAPGVSSPPVVCSILLLSTSASPSGVAGSSPTGVAGVSSVGGRSRAPSLSSPGSITRPLRTNTFSTGRFTFVSVWTR